MKLTQAQIKRIKALENRRGQVTPRRVIEDAKSPKSPLHELFTWSEGEAAEKWWLHQARLIIGAVRVMVTNETHSYRVSGYVVDTTMEGSGYRSTAAITSDPESARESLVYTLEVAAGHVKRAFDLSGPLGLAKEVDALLAQIAGVQRLARSKKAA
jgi:hypothetical protein